MANQNTLMALAYIKIEDNPLRVFCNYICYCMNKLGGKNLVAKSILEGVTTEFGIPISTHMFEACVKMLKKARNIEILNQSYNLVKLDFNLDQYETDRIKLKEDENYLLSEIITFAKGYNQDWSLGQARGYLGDFLLHDGNAVNIFNNGTIANGCKEGYLLPDWYISSYIQKIQHERTLGYDYLIHIVKGLMIYIGVYESSASHQETGQKYRGTRFFFDTRLILRALGYSTEYEIQATNELINLIKDEYNGIPTVFEHIITEVENALKMASQCLRTGQEFKYREMKMFAIEKNYDADDFDICLTNLRENIIRRGIEISDGSITWNEGTTQRNNIDDDTLLQYIKERHQNWQDNSIRNDINSVNQINILRESDYSVAFGGKNHLPIFVTSNMALIFCIRDYIIKEKSNEERLVNWSPSRLPIISDVFLMCRLWLPLAEKYRNLPVLTLSRDAYAAQQSNAVFYDKLSKALKEVEIKHSINAVDLDNERRKKLEEIIVRKTNGCIDDVDEEIVAYSIDELVKMETEADKVEIKRLGGEIDGAKSDLKKQKALYIEAIARQYYNRRSLITLLIYFSKHIWIVSTILLIVIPQIFLAIFDSNLNEPKAIILLSTIIVTVVFELLDKLYEKFNWITKTQICIVQHIVATESKRIYSNLSKEEKGYYEDIVERVFKNSTQVKWFRDKNPSYHIKVKDNYVFLVQTQNDDGNIQQDQTGNP